MAIFTDQSVNFQRELFKAFVTRYTFIPPGPRRIDHPETDKYSGSTYLHGCRLMLRRQVTKDVASTPECHCRIHAVLCESCHRLHTKSVDVGTRGIAPIRFNVPFVERCSKPQEWAGVSSRPTEGYGESQCSGSNSPEDLTEAHEEVLRP